MKWNAILIISLAGAVVGILSLFGLTAGIELFLWTVIALIAAFFIARLTSVKIFLHGIAAGIGMGLTTVIVQVAFFDAYLKNNPFAAAELGRLAEKFSPQWFVLLSSPLVGGIYGMLIGALSVTASKFHHPK